MNNWIKVIIGAIATIIILLIVFIVGSIYMLNKTLPEYSGKKSVQNLNNEVSIYRDNFAIPYVYAKSKNDLYFALGYLHAQERLFQMDISRRAGEGKLSEILGSEAISYDKMFRTFELAKISKLHFENFDADTKSKLISYSNGVNEFIKNEPEKLSIEFDVIGYKPNLWKPEHSVLIAKLMAWELNISWWSDIALSHIIQKLGVEKAKEILPTFDENGPTIIPENLQNISNVPLDLVQVDRNFRKFIGFVGTHIGSNNWVVNGERSESGKPIIANDPHLSFSAPGKWYVAVLRSPDLNVEGVTLPGIPGIVIGKNQNISWVLTNVMADDADFYIEKLDSSKTKYFFNNEWKNLTISEDTIKVKDSSDVIFQIKKNHRGPIISDIHPYKKMYPNNQQNNVDITMRWTALESSNEMKAYSKINSSKNWEEFTEGLKDFEAPGQNFVFADDKGNIGYTAGVKLPQRKNNSPTFINDGTTDENDWLGFVPFSENPKLFNPANGFIASANNKTIKNYPYHISNIWEPNSRINRITELLESKQKHNVDDFKKYQMDFYSDYAKEIVPQILNAFKNHAYENDKLKEVIGLLRKWDFNFISESQVPAIYAVFYQNLMKNIFLDEMGESIFNEYIFIANIPYRVVRKMLEDNSSSWFDDISTTRIERKDEIVRKSLWDAIKYLSEEFGDIDEWQWNKLHTVTFKHFFHGKSKMLDFILDVGPYKIDGDGTTVFNTEYSFNEPYTNKLGPSMRYIYDFAEPNNFQIILPTGQSGNFFSDHYDDMTKMWLNGETIKINTEENIVKNSEYDLLQLVPMNN
ncbi:MAG: penicillin acylase family protein [Ignavibacteriae bacterium]|nr:penicillin acylase family protein [Ignavibacteriota bacterium]